MLYIGFEDKECYLYTIHLRVVIGNVFISEGFSMLSYMLLYISENAKFLYKPLYISNTIFYCTCPSDIHEFFFEQSKYADG